MSTATEITRLTTARDTIRDKLIDLGLATSTSKLDALATAVDGIVNRGAVSATVREGDTYTIPAGYHNGSGTVAGVAGGGNYNLQSKVVTPTKSQQSITPDSGYYGLDSVTVNAIPEAYQNVSSVTATAGDVLSGKVFTTTSGNVAGTMANNGAVSKKLDATSNNQSYTVPAGYHNGSGTVSITLETKSATPTTSSQTITPTAGKVLSSVSVAAIPSQYKDTSNADAVAANVLEGKVFVNGTGEVTGTMENNGAVSIDLYTWPGSERCTIPEGYHDGTGEVFIPLRELPLYVTPSEESQTIPTTVEGSQAATSEVLQTIVVEAIPEKYGDTTGDNAIAANLLSGIKAHTNSNGNATQITGTMPFNDAASVTLDATSNNQSYTIPQGFHTGGGTVGIVLETKTATPSTSAQNITPTSGKVLSKVTVNAIPAKYGDTTGDTAVAANILSGVKAHTISNGTAMQITGTMANNGAVSKTLDATTNNQSYTVPAGYHNGSGTVSITLESKSATPSESSQTITPASGKVLSSVTVNAIPSNYKDALGADAVASNVLYGKVFVNSNGKYTGNMSNYGAVSETLDTRDGHTSYTIPEGYHNGNGTVSIPISVNELSVESTEEEQTFSTTVVNEQTGTVEVYGSVVVAPIPPEYVDVTGTDASPSDVAAGVYFAGQNGVEEGTLPVFSYGSSDDVYLYPETGHTSYTIPHGIHTGEQSVRIDTETKTATPTTSGQNITATAGKVLSSVIVSAIPTQYKDTTNTNAVAADVLSGKTFVNTTGKVTGSMTNNGAVSKTLDATSNNQSYTVPAGYHNGSGTVSITLETKTATPSTSAQNITPTSGKVLSKVTVNAIPAKYGDTTGDTAVAANILSGVKAHTISNGTATQITGTMANNGSLSATIDGLVTTSYTLSAGYYSGGSVSLTNDIETALAAI